MTPRHDSWADEYRSQTVLGLLQSAVVVAGSLFVGVVVKVIHDGSIDGLPLVVRFVRNAGFLLLIIPLAWTYATVRMERDESWFTRRHTIVSGLALLGGWIVFFLLVAGRAGSSLL